VCTGAPEHERAACTDAERAPSGGVCASGTCTPPDGGAPDAGPADAGSSTSTTIGGGCSTGGAPMLLWLAAPLAWLLRRRGRP
jgi:Synergist-CTERM protein sorting domain-containing protein